MAYAQVSDIVTVAPQVTIDNGTKPSAGQVQVFIADVERELNPVLANLGYVTPVTGTEAVKVLRDKVAHAVLAKVLRARSMGATDPKDQGADSAEKVYTDWLKALADSRNPVELPSDATRTGGEVEKTMSELVSSFASDADYLAVAADTPAATRAMVF